VYGGFSTNYTTKVFSESGFEQQYGNGIYRYRILGNALLLKTYDLVKRYNLPTFAPRSLLLLDPAGKPQFYMAYFYLNTFFFCLTSIVLLIIFGAHRQNTDFTEVELPVLLMGFLIAMSQYVVVPYDTLSYFLLCLAILIIIRNSTTLWNQAALCIVVILATLARETAVLILAFYFATHYEEILIKPASLRINQKQGVLLILAGCFLFTYFGLRWVLGYDHAVYQAFLLLYNINLPHALLGILFYLSIALLAFVTTTLTKEISVFFIVTFPYVLFILMFADPWEIRLWTPLILIMIIMKVRASEPGTRSGGTSRNRLSPEESKS
jgi:hypothetical protein